MEIKYFFSVYKRSLQVQNNIEVEWGELIDAHVVPEEPP